MSIQIKGLTKRFNDIVLFQRWNAIIKENGVTCIMGPSGTGKTTLLHIMMGLKKADAGTIEGIGEKKMTCVFQEDRLCEGIDAIQNVLLVCDNTVNHIHVKEEFSKVGLTDYEDKPASELSGGMKRRVAIVRALLPMSDIVFLDEPFKGLDEELKKRVIHYVKEEVIGKTVILVTHDKEEAEALSAEYLYL